MTQAGAGGFGSSSIKRSPREKNNDQLYTICLKNQDNDIPVLFNVEFTVHLYKYGRFFPALLFMFFLCLASFVPAPPVAWRYPRWPHPGRPGRWQWWSSSPGCCWWRGPQSRGIGSSPSPLCCPWPPGGRPCSAPRPRRCGTGGPENGHDNLRISVSVMWIRICIQAA